MKAAPELPDPVVDAVGRWLAHHDDRVPGLVDGLYVIGSAALDDWRPGSDVDIVAFTSRAVTDDDVAAMRSAHESFRIDLPGLDADGPRLRWSDVTDTPRPVVRPWSLGEEFHHDDGCFEIHPVTWRTLARHGVAVRGPSVGELGVDDDDAAVHAFVQENTESYWRAVADQIEQSLEASPDRDEFDASTLSWCVLGIARMLFTARTGDVASKSAAGRWLTEALPDRAPLLERAIGVRHDAEPSPVERAALTSTVDFVRTVADDVAATECA